MHSLLKNKLSFDDAYCGLNYFFSRHFTFLTDLTEIIKYFIFLFSHIISVLTAKSYPLFSLSRIIFTEKV